MVNPLLLILFGILFAGITMYRFSYGLFLLLLLLPSYLVRFTVFGLPMTVLEAMILVVILVGLWRERTRITSHVSCIKNYKLLVGGIVLFLLGATVSVFTGVDMRAALGEWKAFYVEPILVFLIIIAASKHYNMAALQHDNKVSKGVDSNTPTPYALCLLSALVLCGLATSILAIYQHFTGWMVPWAFWENGESFRVTGWYGFPNGVGLFLAPLVPLSLYGVLSSFRAKKKSGMRLLSFMPYALCLALAPIAVLFAKSTGGLIGIAAGVGFLLLIYRRTRIPVIVVSVVGLICLLSIPGLSGIRQEVFAQDRSGQIRVAMWKEAGQLLQERPLLGAGLASYQERVTPFHTTVNGEGIEIFHHPHNLFLTMWVNVGIVGLVGFLIILVWFFRTGFSRNTSHVSRTNFLPLFVMGAMVTILTTGLVDSPYIKNDLSIVFWFLVAMMVVSAREKDIGRV